MAQVNSLSPIGHIACYAAAFVLLVLAAGAVYVLVDDLSQPQVDAPIMSSALVAVFLGHAWRCIAAARSGRGVGWLWLASLPLTAVGLPLMGYGLDEHFFWVGRDTPAQLAMGGVLLAAGLLCARADGIRYRNRGGSSISEGSAV